MRNQFKKPQKRGVETQETCDIRLDRLNAEFTEIHRRPDGTVETTTKVLTSASFSVSWRAAMTILLIVSAFAAAYMTGRLSEFLEIAIALVKKI